MEKKKILKVMSKIYLVMGLVFIVSAFGFLSISFYPSIWYSLNKEATNQEQSTISSLVGDIKTDTGVSTTQDGLPPLDESLPKENIIRISSIGVDSKIIEDTNAKKGLDKGTWIVPNFGKPESNDYPIIIAAHRYGYITWSNDFRIKSSFFNLPKTKVGDRVQIIWGQRSYEYEIYKAEDKTQVTDYNADLILYTCRMYNSPVRVFRYLMRVPQ